MRADYWRVNHVVDSSTFELSPDDRQLIKQLAVEMASISAIARRARLGRLCSVHRAAFSSDAGDDAPKHPEPPVVFSRSKSEPPLLPAAATPRLCHLPLAAHPLPPPTSP